MFCIFISRFDDGIDKKNLTILFVIIMYVSSEFC